MKHELSSQNLQKFCFETSSLELSWSCIVQRISRLSLIFALAITYALLSHHSNPSEKEAREEYHLLNLFFFLKLEKKKNASLTNCMRACFYLRALCERKECKIKVFLLYLQNFIEIAKLNNAK